MERIVSVRQIRNYLESIKISVDIIGSLEEIISGFSSVDHYKTGTVTWIGPKRENGEFPFPVTVCILQNDVEIEATTKIIVPNAKAAFFAVLEKFWGDCDGDVESIGDGSVIGSNVKLGENVQIGCNCTIIGDIYIGDRTHIGDNVVIRNRVNIGCDCVVQSLCVIGEDGYGYSEDEFHVKTMIKHFGGVVIEDNVFIGSHTNIARGTIDDTLIGKGTKIAPSTHIGHNNCVGEDTAIICSKLFGSVTVGSNTYISSSVIRNQSKIGSNAIVGMGSVVTKDIEDNKVVVGVPARSIRENSGNEKL